MEPIPLQVEHVLVEFVAETLHQSRASDAVLTPAISSITGRLVVGASVFLYVQVRRTYPLPACDCHQPSQRLCTLSCAFICDCMQHLCQLITHLGRMTCKTVCLASSPFMLRTLTVTCGVFWTSILLLHDVKSLLIGVPLGSKLSVRKLGCYIWLYTDLL